MAGRRGRIALLSLGLLVLAVAGWIGARVFSAGPLEPPRFFYRVKADVTFDGKPYTIDDWVACNTKSFYSPSRGKHWGYQLSVENVGVRTADGGALFIKTPDLCRPAWARHKALEAGEPNTPPLSDVSAPPNHLPEFFWFDDADKPTLVEAYLSDVYYQRPDRRLTINALAIGSVSREPPAGVEVVDFGKKIPNPHNPCELARPYAVDYPTEVKANATCFEAYGAFPYAEDEWRLSPELVAFAEKASPNRLTPMPIEYFREHHVDPALTPKQLNRPSMLDLQELLETGYRNGFGIPHLEETIRGHCKSMLAPVSDQTCRNLRLFDKVLPIVCEDRNCRLIEDEPGVYFMKTYPRPFPDKVLDIRGQEIPLPGGESAGWYDPSTKIFWWVAETIDL